MSLIFSLPFSYKEKIRQTEGVSTVSYGNWFGGIYIDEKISLPTLPWSPRPTWTSTLNSRLSEDQKNAFLRDRRGFMAGQKLAAKYGWRLGDIVTLKGTIFPWQLGVRIARVFTRGKTIRLMKASFSSTGTTSMRP
ncbi:MAG: hypothetical protein MZV70_62055 [Desulfobacterales bacterium]|nr:hypothetical protein [Desulfobacterales bacterium]